MSEFLKVINDALGQNAIHIVTAFGVLCTAVPVLQSILSLLRRKAKRSYWEVLDTPSHWAAVVAFAAAAVPQSHDYGVLFLYVFLPLLNAWADFISAGFTRRFVGHIAEHHPSPARVVWDLVLDVCIALGCLVALLFALTYSLDQWQAHWPATLPFDWRAYRAQVVAGAPGAWVFATMMLASTLLPTLIHWGAGPFALRRYTSHHIVEALQKWQELERLVSSETTYQNITPEIRAAHIVPLRQSLKKAEEGISRTLILLLILLAILGLVLFYVIKP